jgi:uncharacterized membrane protein
MEVANFILLIIILISLLTLKNKVTALQQNMNDVLRRLSPKKEYESSKKEVAKPLAPKIIQPIQQKPPEVPTPEKPIIIPSEAPKVAAISKPVNTSSESHAYKFKQAKPKKPSFLERNPDLEKFIGENLLSKIGIVIFVIGIGFLVKLGIDNDVITEPLRVAIGILIGGLMIGIAHYLRKTFANFSSILIGGALAVLYFTIALAFHEYQLFSQTVAFVIMVIITVFAVILSLAYDRKELAVLAVLGGFGTPFFVSTGSGNITVLFSYLLLLNVGMLSLVYFKKWNIINYLCFGLTYLLFIGVFGDKFVGNEDATRGTMLLFLTLFYLVFFGMNLMYNVKNKNKFEASEITILLTNTGIYFGFGLALLANYHDGLYSGLFTTLVAIFNCVFALLLFKKKDIDQNLLYLLIGLILTFVSLIAPIQLDGNNITLFWAAESVLLLWLAKKSKIEFIKFTSILVLILMLISLVMDWNQHYSKWSADVLPIVFNKVFVTTEIALLALLGHLKLLQKVEQIEFLAINIVWKKRFISIMFALVLYLGILMEFNYQLRMMDLTSSYWHMLLAIYHFIWVSALLLIERYKPSKGLFTLNLFLASFAILAYGTFIERIIANARNLFMNDNYELSGFVTHYALLMLLLFIISLFYQKLHKQFGFKSSEGKIALWGLAIIGLIITCFEVGHVAIISQYNGKTNLSVIQNNVIRSVYPVIWGVSAFVLMIIGMKYKLKTLRIISLVLFCITILKLFVYDLAGNATGKIISFILLGVILLVISFLYQKLKFIIQDDEALEKE